MTASVPWSVNAVEPETWATARDAARRSGLSVGEWLESAIRESAGESSPPRGRTHARNGSDPIGQRLDDIADRLDHLAQPDSGRSRALRHSGREDTALTASIEALNDRIEILMRDMHAADRNAPAEVRSAIQRLDDRIEELFSRGRLTSACAAPELERKLGNIARTIEAMSRRLEQENTRYAAYPIPSTVAELDAAIAEIMVRQSALDGVPSPREFQRRSPAGPDLSNLEIQLKTMADEMQALRRAGVQTETVEALRREIADLAGKLGDLAPRRSLETLEGAVEALVRRIDRADGTGPDQAISEVIQALQDIRSALAEVRPAESFASVEKDLHELFGKLDALNAKGLDGGTVARLQTQTAEIRDLLASALPSEVLKALVEQIEMLVHKFEGAAAPSDTAVLDVVSALDRRIESLSDRIEAATRQVPAAPALDDIRGRLDELQRTFASFGAGSSAGLEATVRSLAEKLDASEARLSNLGAIERGLKDLFAQLQEARMSTREVAERTASSADREMAAPGATATTEPVRRTPGVLETRYAGTAGTPAIAPAPAPRPVPQRSGPRLMPAATRSGPSVNLADDLPADFPLEPGSGVPRTLHMQSASLRVAQSEAALGGIAPKADAGPSRTSDYIAAARRAAQAAAAESPAETVNSRKETASKGQITLFSRSGRAVLIAITAFLLIFTALRYFDGFLPALLRTEITNPAVEVPMPMEPEAKTPAPQNRSVLSDPGGTAITGAPAAGVLGPNREVDLLGEKALGEKAADPDTTGSIDTAKRTSGPPQTAAVPTKPDMLAAQSAELPAMIGTPALRTAAIAGEPAAAYEIGSRYIEGRGVQANAAEAVKWLERALAKGSVPAAYRLGSLYEKALGVAKNPAEARRYYTIAAEGGHIKAMHNLAVLHAEGIDGKPDYRSGARWFRMAADRGVRDSQYNLGILYARGLGVEQNLAESFRWFALAAAQGDADAAKKRDDVAKRLDMQTLVAAKLAVQTWSATPADDAANAVHLKPEWEKAEAGPPRKRSVKNSTPPPPVRLTRTLGGS